MPSNPPSRPSSISTGIEGLDDILRGGFPENRLYLVEGAPGTGKTTLALQFLLEGARRGESGLYVTLSESSEELRAVAQSHGWSLDDPPTPARAPSRPRRIVVVEDHDDARDALQILLTLQGHEVRTASDGLTGVALILEVQPDVALIDVGLPGLDGYAVARRVRQGAMSPEIRLVAVTGYGQPYDRSRAREAGFDLHLTKPVSPEDIGEALSGS